jgi:hypothetical protein
MLNRLHILVLLSGLQFLLTACTTTIGVSVDAITDSRTAFAGKRYLLTSGNAEVSSADLYFQEFSRYFDYILQKKGYIKVTDFDNADMEILLSFNLSDGRTGISTYSWPNYETYGGGVVTVTETRTVNGVKTTTERRVHVPSQIVRVGDSYETRSYTIYSRSAHIIAIPTAGKDKEIKPLWDVSIRSVGESDDLRFIMPFMVAAAEPYIGINTGRQQNIELKENDPRVQELMRLVVETPTSTK